MCGGAVARRRDGRSTSCPRWSGAACGVAVLRLLTSGRFSDCPDRRPSTADAPDRGRRLSLGDAGFSRRRCAQRRGGGVVLSRMLRLGLGRPRCVRAAAGRRQPLPRCRRRCSRKALRCRRSSPATPTSTASTPRCSVPQLSRADWQLRIHGMVDREITYRFDDLDRFEVVEKLVTLTCVSNPVGGELISNATWPGYRVRDLLAEAGVHSGRRHGAVDVDRRVHRGHPRRGTHRRPRRAAGGRDERRAAAARTRLSGPAGRPRPVRLCLGHQMGGRPGVDPIRPGRGVLDTAGLVAAWADQDRVPHRRAAQWCRTSPSVR